MFIFLDTVFPSVFFKGFVHTYSNYSVYDGCVHALICRTHYSEHSALTAHTRMAQGSKSPKRFIHCTCVIPFHLAFFLLMFHLSLLFLHFHFETNADYDLTDSDIHKFLPTWRRTRATPYLHRAVCLPGQVRCKHNLGGPCDCLCVRILPPW